MNQKRSLKPGLLRLLTILVPLLALFFILTLISHQTPTPQKTPLCPFILAVSPPFQNPTGQAPELFQDINFFRSVLSHFKIGSDTSLELVFYLPLHFTKDNRWLVSKSPFLPLHTLQQTSQTTSLPRKISRLTLEEIEKRLSPRNPLTLKDMLSRFPNHKWFLNLFTEFPQKAFKSLRDLPKKTSTFYLTSHNEKLLNHLSEKQMTVISSSKSLLRFQLLSIFRLEKLFSFPGQGLVIPSTFFLSPAVKNKLRHYGQWLFLQKETVISELPPQKLNQVKGLTTREWKPALKWIRNKNPCLQGN